jgi:rubredoxin
MDRFEILHTRDFNPNSKDFITYKTDVGFEELTATLIELCDYFYELQTNGTSFSEQETNVSEEIKTDEISYTVHQCKHCQTVYDEEYGDETNHIAPGTAFVDLPVEYCCQTCESPKADFLEVDRNALLQNSLV